MKFNGNSKLMEEKAIIDINEAIFKNVYNVLSNNKDYRRLKFYKFLFEYYEIAIKKYKDYLLMSGKDANEIYNLLLLHDYNLRNDIMTLIYKLGNLSNPNKNQKIINGFLRSPVIDDVSFNGKNRFSIHSEKFGDIEFELLLNRYKNCINLINYCKKNHLNSHCHENAKYMAGLFKELYTITSKLDYYFVGTYYHSYTYDKDNNEVLNLNNNSIICKEDYNRIYGAKEIMCIPNCDLHLYAKEADEYCIFTEGIFDVAKIAINEERKKIV